MTILLLGKDGQVGWELQRSLAPLDNVIACGRAEANLENLAGLSSLVRRHQPQIIVNAAAYTAVDKAETESERARRINTEAVAVLAEEARLLNAWLIHYSTDYVFDGHKQGEYTELDVTAPGSVYGQSKRDGEIAITHSGCQHLIFRTSWVFSPLGNNFGKTILRLARERDELRVVCDQIGAPSSAELIADVTAHCLRQLDTKADESQTFSGIYHLVAGGEVSWHGYAQWLITQAVEQGAELRTRTQNVIAIPSEEYPLPAPRPLNSRLSTRKLQETFGLTIPHWQYHAKRFVSEMLSHRTAKNG